MQFLANENRTYYSISTLSKHYLPVRKGAIFYKSKPTIFLLQEGILNRQMLHSFNKDFAASFIISFIISFIKSCKSIVFFRLDQYLLSSPATILLQVMIKAEMMFTNNCTVIYEHKTRQQPIN